MRRYKSYTTVLQFPLKKGCTQQKHPLHIKCEREEILDITTMMIINYLFFLWVEGGGVRHFGATVLFLHTCN